MAGAGMVMLLLSAWAVLALFRGAVERSRLLLRLLPLAIVLPYAANTTGWIFTEIGRVPWVAFGLMKIENGLSPSVTGGEVLFTLVAFTLLYGVLMAADIYLLNKFAKAGLRGVGPEEGLSTVDPAIA
jgi:cytochrome d ubiquinol oxidase subunit I